MPELTTNRWSHVLVELWPTLEVWWDKLILCFFKPLKMAYGTELHFRSIRLLNKDNLILSLQENWKMLLFSRKRYIFIKIEMRSGRKVYEFVRCQQKSTSNSIFISNSAYHVAVSLQKKARDIYFSLLLGFGLLDHMKYELCLTPSNTVLVKQKHLSRGGKENPTHAAILL